MFNLIVSSPNDKLIEEISNQLSQLIETHSSIQIGATKFDLQNLMFPLKIITSAHIWIRIPQQKVIRELGSNSVFFREVYWRDNYPMSLFIEGLESNLDKKYRDYTTLGIKKNTNDSLFTEYSFKKQVSTKIHMHDTDVIVIGSLWELGFSQYIDESVQIFVLDCGLGERNSLGFGFVNELNIV
jgi:CRISPR-associated endoribonuclease Cas6